MSIGTLLIPTKRDTTSRTVSRLEVAEPRKHVLTSVALLAVIHNVKPTILIGTSTHARAFTEDIVKEMAKHVERPIIVSRPGRHVQANVAWTDIAFFPVPVVESYRARRV